MLILLVLATGACVANKAADPSAASAQPPPPGPRIDPSEAESYPPLELPVSFPSRADLAAIATRPVPNLRYPATKAVQSWQFDETSPRDPNERAFAKLVGEVLEQEKKGRMTAAMSCVARELGRFELAHHAQPEESLKQYIFGRCGGTSTHRSRLRSFRWDVKQGAYPKSIQEKLRATLTELTTPDSELGLWYRRQGSRVLLTLVRADTYVVMHPDHPTPFTGDSVRLRGRVTAPGGVYALINQGQHGVTRCQPDPAVALPEFDFSCPVRAGDDQVWVNIVRERAGLLLHVVNGEILVRRAGVSASYVQQSATAVNVPSPTELQTEVLNAINGARAAAGLRPLVHAPDQSKVNSSVSRQLFAATVQNDLETTNTIAWGLMAGRDVPGEIVNGSIISTSQLGARSAKHFAEFFLNQPMARSTWLNPDLRVVALGVTIGAPVDGLGIVATKYRVLTPGTEPRESAQVFAHWAALRTRARLEPLQELPNPEALSAACQRIAAGEHPRKALRTALAQIPSGTAVAGEVIVAQDLVTLALPEPLKRASRAATSVCHLRLPGAEWASYIVLYAYESR